MTDPLPDVLATGAPMTWFIGQVTAWDSPNKRLTVKWRGGTVTNVAYLKSYAAPAVNDIVHGMVWEPNGMLVWGVEELRPAVAPPTPPAQFSVVPTGKASYVTVTNPPASPVTTWVPNVIEQSPDSRAAWFFAANAFAGVVGKTMAKVEIQITLPMDSDPLGFVLHHNAGMSTAFTPVGPVYMHHVMPYMSDWHSLPISWAAALADGTALGVGLSSDLYSATVDTGGTLRFTPL
jgi:hypothetical protein